MFIPHSLPYEIFGIQILKIEIHHFTQPECLVSVVLVETIDDRVRGSGSIYTLT